MNCVEKLFKQHPFIYRIQGEYYAFGNGVCVRCNDKSVLLESRYKNFELNAEANLEPLEAWKIFHVVVSEAKHQGDFQESRDVISQFEKIGFNEQAMDELEKQVDRYIKYYRDNGLSRFA